MKARHAAEADRERIVAMMPEANLSAGFGPNGIIPLDPTPEHLHTLFSAHLQCNDACIISYAPDGMVRGFLMAALFAHPVDPRVRIAKDTAWWIEPESRGLLGPVNQMLALYEEWAFLRGCGYAGMAAMAGNPRVGKLYERRGYVLVEMHWLKKL